MKNTSLRLCGKILVTIILTSLLFGCASSKLYKEAKTSQNIEVYKSYLQKFPDGKHAEEARLELNALYEERDWKEITGMNTIPAYETFISRYPSGKHSTEARQKLAGLQEQKAWNDALKSNTIEGYDNFEKSFPSSSHVPEAIEKIKQLREDIAWNDAIKTGTIPAFEGFLNAYPGGTHAGSAAEKLRELKSIYAEYQIAASENSILAYQRFIEKYPGTPYTSEAGRQLRMLDLEEWDKANVTNTIESFEQYLSLLPKGEFSVQAEKRIVDLSVDEIFKGEHGSLPSMNKVSGGDFSDDNEIEIYNNTSYTLTLYYSGPDSRKLVFNPNQTLTLNLPRGDYRVAASVDAAGIGNYAGEEKLEGGYYSVEYYIVTRYY